VIATDPAEGMLHYVDTDALATARRSRRRRYCLEPFGAWAHDPVIKRGDVYLSLAVPPGGVLGMRHWYKMTCCAECAANTSYAALIEKRQAKP
jgi:hypothetical protein